MSATGFPLHIPTLGRQVLLGELYNQRTGRFLGVSLYPDAVGKRIHTPSSTLHINQSTTLHNRVALFGLHPHISLGVFGELIKVSGSARYLHFNDDKETTSVSLKLITREERLPIISTPLPIADQDYFQSGKATHFVSSLTYGAFLIAIFSARKSKERASMGNIGGMVKKLFSAAHEGTNKIETMEEHLEFIFYSDLKDTPLNLRDLVNTFHNAPARIADDGVAISATLQPVRTGLEEHLIPTMLASDLSEVFSQLAALRHRFAVLKDNTRNLSDIAPKLEQKVVSISERYAEAHESLLGELAASVERHGNQVLTHVHNEAMNLCNRYLGGKGQETERQYPSTLTGLEERLSYIEHFCVAVDDVYQPLLVAGGSSIITGVNRIHGSNMADLFRAVAKHGEVPVFIMPPLAGDDQDYPLTATYTRILREYSSYFRGIKHPPYLIYVEDLDVFEKEFADHNFPSLLDPSLFIVRFDDKYKLTWDPVPGKADTPGPEPASMQAGHRNLSWYSTILSCCCLGKRARSSLVTDVADGAPKPPSVPLAATSSPVPLVGTASSGSAASLTTPSSKMVADAERAIPAPGSIASSAHRFLEDLQAQTEAFIVSVQSDLDRMKSIVNGRGG